MSSHLLREKIGNKVQDKTLLNAENNARPRATSHQVRQVFLFLDENSIKNLWILIGVKLPYEPVCRSVGLVGLSIIISYKGGKFHSHAPIRSLVLFWSFNHKCFFTSTCIHITSGFSSLEKHNIQLFKSCRNMTYVFLEVKPVRLLVGWTVSLS